MKSASIELQPELESHSISTLLWRWVIGAAVGTSLIAVTSPFFLRSYLPLKSDSVRGVWTLPPGSEYRWRSEGYADTSIGPLGMPGKITGLKSISVLSGERSEELSQMQRSPLQIALWGDSQAEGVSVDDADKLFAKIESASNGDLNVYPLARSGEDAADWVTQMPRVEKQLGIDQHVILVVEPTDLLAAVEAPVASPSANDASAANSALAAKLPAFVIQAARNVLREPDRATPRRLRFTVGPVGDASSPLVTNIQAEKSKQSGNPLSRDDSALWLNALTAIRDATELPIVLLYAPLAPQIADGRIRWQDPTADQFLLLQKAAEKLGMIVVDARDELRSSVASDGRWPHGFHNGRIGSGHLNQVGNQVLAARLVEGLSAPRVESTLSNPESRD
ncbi:MAG: hypothetical protein L7W43_09190 [Rubripirellula sp.]|nr:hypothetical protein [Rubripirellula sp.]